MASARESNSHDSVNRTFEANPANESKQGPLPPKTWRHCKLVLGRRGKVDRIGRLLRLTLDVQQVERFDYSHNALIRLEIKLSLKCSLIVI